MCVHLPSVADEEAAEVHPGYYSLHHERLRHEEVRKQLRRELEHIQDVNLGGSLKRAGGGGQKG